MVRVQLQDPIEPGHCLPMLPQGEKGVPQVASGRHMIRVQSQRVLEALDGLVYSPLSTKNDPPQIQSSRPTGSCGQSPADLCLGLGEFSLGQQLTGLPVVMGGVPMILESRTGTGE